MEATKECKSSRGLKQAPFLFLIVAQGLSGLVNQIARKSLFTSLKIGTNKVDVKLIQFVDETLVICEPSFQNYLAIKSIFKCFELGSGLSELP